MGVECSNIQASCARIMMQLQVVRTRLATPQQWGERRTCSVERAFDQHLADLRHQDDLRSQADLRAQTRARIARVVISGTYREAAKGLYQIMFKQ